MKRTKNRSWLVIFALALAMVGIYYRFASLENKAFWHDEVYTSLFLAGTPNHLVQQMFTTGQPLAPQQLQYFQHLHDDKNVFDVVKALLAYDPHHPPLYYVMLWVWAQTFGDSAWVIRAFSALCGVLVLPAWFWLCRELFQSQRAAFIGLALMALSPFQVLFSQEARPYSIWSLAVCLSCAALLHAVRIGSRRAWLVYSATLLFGLYTHLLFALVVAAHVLWMLFSSKASVAKADNADKGEDRVLDITKALRQSFARSIGIATVLYVPFLLLLLRRQDASRAHLDWTSVSTSAAQRFEDWTSNLSVAFFDISPFKSQMLELRVLVAIFAVGALFFTVRFAPRTIKLFIALLFLCSLLPFLLPDLLLGGRRSQVARFLIPALLALQLAIVYAFYTFSKARKPWCRFGVALAVLLIGGGWISCEVSRRNAHWWNKGRNFAPLKIASAVNRASRPLVVSNARAEHWGNALALSKYLRDDARIILHNDAKRWILPTGFSTIFVVSPDDEMQTRFKNSARSLQKTPVENLWQLTPR